jgi:hypothetical protein
MPQHYCELAQILLDGSYFETTSIYPATHAPAVRAGAFAQHWPTFACLDGAQ